MSHDIFISHSAKDKATADTVCARLEVEGFRCWIAPRDILAGLDWGEAILNAIEGCTIMVLIFSEHANTSVQIKREVERAVHKGKIIVPFRIENVMPSGTLEYFICTPHWLDALTPPLEKHIEDLAATIKSLLTGQDASEALSALPPHMFPPPPAVGWSVGPGRMWHLLGISLGALVVAALTFYLVVGRLNPIKDEGVSTNDSAAVVAGGQYGNLSNGPLWNQVVDEARRLRKVGRIGEAVAAFARYEQLFADKYPSTKQYVRTAQAFTQQHRRLGIIGGAYLYEIIANGIADKFGLAVGDIIVGYDEQTVTSTKTFVDLRATIVQNKKIRIDFLRMDEAGNFEKKHVMLPGGPLGVQIMNI